MPEHEGNGEIMKEAEEIKKEKTPEELKREKEKLFYENPDRFIDTHDLVISVGKMGVYFNHSIDSTRLMIAKEEVDLLIAMELMGRKTKQMIKDAQNKRIITADQNKKGFRRFIRGK